MIYMILIHFVLQYGSKTSNLNVLYLK